MEKFWQAGMNGDGALPHTPHPFFLDTKKDAKKVKAGAVFPKNYGSPGLRNTTDSKVGG